MNDTMDPRAEQTPDFSVVIPSRNRPALVRAAVESVLRQTHRSREIIVVNDGSDLQHSSVYEALQTQAQGEIRLIELQRTANGHGPSYAINRGVEAARGRFVCFLDDDDSWTDEQHLARIASAVAERPSVDLYFSCQAAFKGEQLVTDELWLNGLKRQLDPARTAAPGGEYAVGVADLLCCPTFAHLNTMVVRKPLYAEAGGMDESIRYECEWDLYFRLIEHAQDILYFPGTVARHNVPDPTQRANASTVVPDLHKLLLRIRVMDKALLLSDSVPIRCRAGEVKSNSLKHIAAMLAGAGKWQQSLRYASEALIPGFNPKWFVYWCYLAARATFSRNQR
jgi:glycosyltransferase involved in cell wall biosynthesis